MIADPVCANLQSSVPSKILTDSVVMVIAIRMGFHCLSVRTVRAWNHHNHFWCVYRRGGLCGVPGGRGEAGPNRMSASPH
jgi:hypothetical protein